MNDEHGHLVGSEVSSLMSRREALGAFAAGLPLYAVAAPGAAWAASTGDSAAARERLAKAARARGRASFAKCLPHDDRGDVPAEALEAIEAATVSMRPEDWERLPTRGVIRLANPWAGYLWDSPLHTDPLAAQVEPLPPPPAFDSQELAEEMLECYWAALIRDVPFADYDRSALVAAAVSELRKTRRFAQVSPERLLRGPVVRAWQGRYLSQLLWMPVPYGAQLIWQTYRVPFRAVDFMITWEDYLKVIRGEWPPGIKNLYSDQFYLRSARDLACYTQMDLATQAFTNAAAILSYNQHGRRDNLALTHPYKASPSMEGFVTFGPAYAINSLGVISDIVLRATWHEKWLRHRALRPEEYGALVERTRRGENLGLPAWLLDTEAVKRTVARQGNALLSQVFPEGCPSHPAYPAGHAAVAGACTTVLKALFDENQPIRFPIQPARDGRDWEALDRDQPTPTVGSELDKLAINIAFGRNFAGVHFWADSWWGLELGERVAIAWLREQLRASIEYRFGRLSGFEFKAFDGRTVRIRADS
ncbi:MAG: hypothetical protein ACK4XK_09795 [Casimicrobiaceae bacterium]